jgi:hypothetical protein
VGEDSFDAGLGGPEHLVWRVPVNGWPEANTSVVLLEQERWLLCPGITARLRRRSRSKWSRRHSPVFGVSLLDHALFPTVGKWAPSEATRPPPPPRTDRRRRADCRPATGRSRFGVGAGRQGGKPPGPPAGPTGIAARRAEGAGELPRGWQPLLQVRLDRAALAVQFLDVTGRCDLTPGRTRTSAE